MSQTYKGLHEFIFPEHIEHPDTTGRLELLAYLGPAEGKLFGGYLGRHEVQDGEITGMILQQVTETCRKIIGKAKDAVVAEAVKKSFLSRRITEEELVGLVKTIPVLDSGCLDFRRLQQVVLGMHHARISEIADQLSSKSLNQGVVVKKVGYRHADTKQYTRKQKSNDVLMGKLHRGVFSITHVDEVASTESVRSNIKLIRPLGPFGDKWDRSCATRNTGKTSYVGGRGVLTNDFEGIL